MSEEFAKARQQLSMIRTYLKQDKALSAVQAVQTALLAMLKNPLIQSERKDFEKGIADAIQHFTYSDAVQAAYPLKLSYTPGNERALYDTMADIKEEMSRTVAENAQEHMEALDRKKKEWLARGIAELSQNIEKGQETLSALLRAYPTDPQLRGGVGEALLHAGVYERAVSCLTDALDMKPDMLPLYNSIGIALRKLSRFEVAETYYLRASQYLRHDPNLYFNLGRLYVDWKKWNKAVQAAQVALKLNPEFAEAKKLLEYAQRHVATDDTSGKG